MNGMIKKAVFYLLSGFLRVILKTKIENCFSRVPIRYINIRESLRERQIAWKYSPCMWARVFTSISRYSYFYNCMETQKMSSISNIQYILLCHRQVFRSKPYSVVTIKAFVYGLALSTGRRSLLSTPARHPYIKQKYA